MKRRGFIQTLFAGLGAAMLPRAEQPETTVKPYNPKSIPVTVQGEQFPACSFDKLEPTNNFQGEKAIIYIGGEPISVDKNATAQAIARAINKNPRLTSRADVENDVVILTSKMDKSK